MQTALLLAFKEADCSWLEGGWKGRVEKGHLPQGKFPLESARRSVVVGWILLTGKRRCSFWLLLLKTRGNPVL